MKKPIANPSVVLREELDDWALLFDPDTDNIFSLDPVAVFIWKRLDGQHTLYDILEETRRHCEHVPEDAEKYINNFIEDLTKRGLAGFESQDA